MPRPPDLGAGNVAICEQLRAVGTAWLVNPAGRLTPAELRAVLVL